MKTPVFAFTCLLLLVTGAFAQGQPAPGAFMPVAAPQMRSANDTTALGAVAQQKGADIANRIKFRGYVDMMYSHTEMDLPTGSSADDDQGVFGVKSVDLDFLFDFSPVTAEIHLQHEHYADEAVGVEQAFVNYAFNQNFSLTFGRQAQLLGYEGDEATDQFLSTRTYLAGDNFDLFKNEELFGSAYPNLELSDVVGNLHHNYNDGVRANFNSGRFGLALGLYDGIWKSDSEDSVTGFGDGEWGIDIQAAYVITPGLEARVGYARHNDYDGGDDADIDQLNFWISYEVGNWTLAGEYNDYDIDFAIGTYTSIDPLTGLPISFSRSNEDGRAWMLMANYAFTDRIGATLRYSNEDFDSYDTWKLSVGPSFRITENFLTRFEYSYAEADIYDIGTDGGDRDINAFIAEGLFSF